MSIGWFIETKHRTVVTRGWGAGNRELLSNGHRLSVGMKRVPEMDSVNSYTA